MDGVATKPFSPAELVAEIARLAAGGDCTRGQVERAAG
jgi:DNA-binding response OmpR family regulator